MRARLAIRSCSTPDEKSAIFKATLGAGFFMAEVEHNRARYSKSESVHLNTILLTPFEARNCTLDGAYTAWVPEGFPKALKRLIGNRNRRDIIRAGLGLDADEKRVHAAASYLSRILSGVVQSPGVEQIRVIAKGLGYSTLSQFFAALEGDDVNESLQTSGAIAHNPAFPHSNHAGSAFSFIPINVNELLRELVRVLGKHIDLTDVQNAIGQTVGDAAQAERDRSRAAREDVAVDRATRSGAGKARPATVSVPRHQRRR